MASTWPIYFWENYLNQGWRHLKTCLSCPVQDSTSKEINNILTNFAWKNRHHYLKKDILSGPRGFDLLNFFDLNNTFKIKWIKECLRASDSIWYFIPNNILKKIGWSSLFTHCNYKTTKLPLKSIQMYSTAWKLLHTQLSPTQNNHIE